MTAKKNAMQILLNDYYKNLQSVCKSLYPVTKEIGQIESLVDKI